MKFSGFILAIFILFLAVKPGVETLLLQSGSQTTCCAEKCAPDAADAGTQNNDFGGDTCNPFQVCSACVLVCPQLQLFAIAAPTRLSAAGFSYLSVFHSQFAADVWQPPKIV